VAAKVGNRGGRSKSISEINVTPLVDVVLVLLVIFMVAAPSIYKSSIKVKLPEASTGEKASSSQITFTIDEKGALFWNNNKIDWDSLAEKIKTIDPLERDQVIVVSGDQGANYGFVVRLMDTLRAAGMNRFSLNVQKKANP
jgi:biopolymer transport protein TolR